MAVENVVAPDIEELDASAARNFPSARLAMEDLHKVPLTITAELGSTQMKVRDVLALKVGSLVVLDKYAGQMTDIVVNSQPMAKGEIVVMGDSLHVRLAETTGSPSGEQQRA